MGERTLWLLAGLLATGLAHAQSNAPLPAPSDWAIVPLPPASGDWTIPPAPPAPSPPASAPTIAGPPRLALIPPLPPWPDFSAPPRFQGPTGVTVTLQTDNELSANLLTLTPLGWRTVCTSPCATRVDSRNTFAVGGVDIHPSSPFRIEQNANLVASPATDGYAIFALSTAGFFLLHGGIFYLTGSSIKDEPPGPTFRTIGMIELIAMVPLAIWGSWQLGRSTPVSATPGLAAQVKDLATTGLTF